jgi:hypothetical protein
LLIEYGRAVEHGNNFLSLNFGRPPVQIDHDAREPLLAEGDEHASSDYGRVAIRDSIRERGIERHRQGDIAELRHAEDRINQRRERSPYVNAAAIRAGPDTLSFRTASAVRNLLFAVKWHTCW